VTVHELLCHGKPGRCDTVPRNRLVLSLIMVAVLCALLGASGCAHEPTQVKTGTMPFGYFELTVSPGEVYVNVGESVEIRCSIRCLINTVVQIDSVDALLFNSYGSVIREQAMTKDSYWSSHIVYTIVGDEAYYQIKFSFSIRGDPSGEHLEYGVDSFPIIVNQE
jgi:hypothetical protein